MKRFHVHVHVDDLGKSIAFYSKLFAAEPARVESDYAKWMLDDPRINFAISTRGSAAGVDHLGFQVDDAAELAELKARAEAADMALLDEGETTCCYARSDKHWITDPQGIAWEHFHSLGNIPVFSEGKKEEVATEGSACCAPRAPGGKPIGIATYNVLFICTGNSARSILAEGLLNHLGGDRFKAFSAGSHPAGAVNPFALHALQQFGIPTDGFRSKSWDEFSQDGAPELDFVFTVCDKAAGEVCPVWPGQPMTAHWGVVDPAAVEGSDERKQQAIRDAAITLKRRIELFLSLPIPKLDTVALQKAVRDIGQQ
ncbi:hypothetical protein DL763_011506 [Monosporascus cannonballus]|nr:hypothetical protein DL763_011506 [Monosporascus cannonballus]